MARLSAVFGLLGGLAALSVAPAQPLRERPGGPATSAHTESLALSPAREFLIRNWDTRSGLPSATVTAIQRTADGFLWIGTRQGLVRFDGAQFRTFDSRNTPQLESGSVTCLLVDRVGALWIGTAAGLYQLRPGRPGASGLRVVRAGAAVAALAEDASGTVWAALPGVGLVGFAVGPDASALPVPVAGIGAGGAPAIEENARLFVCESNRLCVFSGGRLWWREAEGWTPFEAAQAGAPAIEALCPSAGGGLWFAGGRQLFRLRHSVVTPVASAIPPEENVPRARVDVLLEDRAGRVWAGTHGGGIFCYQEGAGWQRVTARRARPVGAVTCLHEDRDGLLWAGTSNRGLYQVRPRLVTAWSLPIAAHEGTPHTVCVARDGSVWVGTDGAGVFRFGNGVVTRFDRAQGLEQPSVAALLEDRETNLWCATSRGLYRFESGRFRRVTDPALGRKTVTALFEDRAGRLWIGLAGALALRRGESFELFELPGRGRPHEIRAIAEDSAGRIWVGARGAGLFRLERGGLKHVETFLRPLVLALHCDAEDALWVGTMNGGLARVQGRTVRRWTTQDGLPDNTIYAIQEDARGTLWVSSNEGVFGLDKAALLGHVRASDPPLLARHLPLEGDVADLACLASGQPSATRSSDGRFWFPTVRGLVAFDPMTLPERREPPVVLVEHIRVDGVPLESVAAPGPQQWRVRSGARRIEFHYTSPEMESPGRLRFRYRLDGLDEDWVEAGAQRVASYAQLPPGRYRFHVMAGAHGVWRAAPAPVALEIVPRLWERRSVRGIGLLVALGLVAVTVRVVERARLRRQLARLETQQAMEKERARIARDLHDDLGSGLTEILLLGELASRSASAPEELRAQLEAITEKVRQLAAAMDEVVWTVNPRNDSLPRLASYLADRAREFFRPTAIACRIDVPDELPDWPLTAPQRHHLLLAFKEALHNVARHSGASEVWLRLRCDDGRLCVAVEDNGRGLPASGAEAAGDGLANMRARLEAVGGRAEIAPRAGGGTVVRFILPLDAPAPAQRGSRRSG